MAERHTSEGRRESWRYRLAIYTVLVVGGLPVLLPLYWLVLASLKTNEAMTTPTPDWLPLERRDFIELEGQRVRVSVFDDGEAAQTHVARVKLHQGEEAATLVLPAGRLQKSVVSQHFARIDGNRRRVEPLDGSGAGKEVQVALIGTMREATVPADQLRVTERVVGVWSVLGEELIAERLDGSWEALEQELRAAVGAPEPETATVSVILRWDSCPPIRVAPSLVRDAAGTGATVRWNQRELPAEITSRDDAAGLCTVRLRCPEGGVPVPAAEVRVERRFDRSALVGEEWREVRVLSRDASAGTALVEIPHEPKRARVPKESVDRVETTVYSTELLGARERVEPLDLPLPDDPEARVAVRVPDALAINADRVEHQTRLMPQWSNYAAAWNEQEFALYIVNTLFIASLVVLGTVLSCGLVGYGFARFDFRGRDGLFLLLLSTMMIPAQVMSIPTFVMFAKFGWLDSFKPMIVPHFLAFSAFFVFLYRQFMLTIPADLEDSARIDGCGPLRTWWLIMMPLSKPIIVTVAVFSFIGVWNDFLYPLLYINSDEKQTVALGLQSFKTAYAGAAPQLIMAASVMMILPTVLLFFVAQKAFIRGVVVTGVKG